MTKADVYEFPCQACGASLEFSPGAQKLVCTHCGAAQDLSGGAKEPILEHSFEDASRQAKRVKAKDLADEGVETRCDGCGARAIVTGAATRCAFCDSPVVIAPSEDELFRPESLLPFDVDGTRARAKLSKWLSSRWFAPNDLVRHARRQGIDGVYLPYWCFDADTKTRYFGKRGTHYEIEIDDKKVRKTRWRPKAGVVRLRFDDVLVPATRSIPQKILDRLEPWDLEELLAFETAYLSGFQAERYAIDLDDGFGVAKTKMKREIRQEVQKDIGGDAQMVLSMHCRHSGVMFKHFLLPLWISSYRYKGEVYRFVVNARTGEASGERPYSAVKIGLLVATIVTAIALWLYYRG